MDTIEWIALVAGCWAGIGFIVALAFGRLLRAHDVAVRQTAPPLHLNR